MRPMGDIIYSRVDVECKITKVIISVLKNPDLQFENVKNERFDFRK